ncbi:MAG: type IV pili twitching motility protein PilT, partial [Proteobacteria bacterium]|nr:type IV pili twitching motility protein PilT [Pseudomonadota bacterium]
MQRLFQLMAEKSASDIFISVGAPINIKLNGVAMPINQQVMDSQTITGLLHEILN